MEISYSSLEENDLKGIHCSFSSKNINNVNKDGYTPLYFCCMKENIQVSTVEEIIKMGADVDLKGEDDETPLFIAAFHNRKDVVKLLLASGADINGVNGKRRETALHVSAYFGYESLLIQLVKNGANINVRNSLLETPAYCAAKCGKHCTLYHLIATGANMKLANEDGKEPLFIASERKHRNAVLLLKASKNDLKHAKSAADAEISSTQGLVLSSEEIASRMKLNKDLQSNMKAQKLDSEEQPQREYYRTEIIDIHVPQPKARIGNPFSGDAYGPCKSLEEVGYDKPPELPEALQNLPLQKPRRIGSTVMTVETENGPVKPIRIDELMEDADVSYYIPQKLAF